VTRTVQETKQVPTELELDYEEDAPTDAVQPVPSEEDLVRLNSELDAVTRPVPTLCGNEDGNNDDDDDDPL
jgi:hypothetical protein